MIPKTIHYCWFGGAEKPTLIKHCIRSWKKRLPDYEIKEWNESNFDTNMAPFCQEAYAARKYAFVADFCRVYALATEGGIYMDTDVEVLKPYDDLLSLPAFTGYEGSKFLPPVTGTMASIAGGEWVKEQLSAYDGIHFVDKEGRMDLTTNTVRISAIMKEGGFVQDGKKQIYKDMHIFPVEYFCPRQTTGEILMTGNTYCDHHFMGSWSESKKNGLIARLVGQRNMIRLIKLKRKILG